MQSNREEQARLLSLAVHEFRTPITVVAGYLRMLLRHYGASFDEQPRKLLEEAEKSCGRLSALVSELSEVAQLDDGRTVLARQDIPIFALLAEVAAGVHEGEDRGILLRVVAPSTDAMVVGDRPRLARALGAVLTATLRESVEAGVVLVRGEVVAGWPWNGGPAHERTALIVVDEGIETDGYRFDADAWGELQEFRGGNGLALPVARRVIEGTGGRVWSRRDAGRRAALALALPVKEKLG